MIHSSTRHDERPDKSINGRRPPDSSDIPPLLDRSVLDQFTEELEELAYTKAFFDSFIDLMPHRIERLRLALVAGSFERALDAVLSLKSSSQMIGARRLAGLAAALESGIRDETTASNAAMLLPRYAAGFINDITQCGDLTCNSLRAHC